MDPAKGQTSDRDFQRVLGPTSATCIVVGAIVGVGIFFTPSDVATIVGSPELALLTWGVGGALALVGALTFAELGGMYPRTGGQYEILRDSYGPGTGFLFVFCNSTAIQAGATAIIAHVSAINLGVFVAGVQPGDAQTTLIAALMIAGLMAANVLGVRWGARVQNITVFSKIAALAVIILLAWIAYVPAPETTSEAASSSAQVSTEASWLFLVFAGMVPVMFSFGGWQHALWIGGEIRNPERNVPLAILLGVGIVIVFYLLVNWAYLRLLDFQSVTQTKTLAADAVSRVWPNVGRRFIAAAVAFSAFGVLNAQLLSGPRLVCGMARDGRFFSLFSKVHPVRGTPVSAILLIGGMGLVLLLVAGVQGVGQILAGVVLIDTVFFALTAAAVFILRKKKPDVVRPVRALFYPVVPALFVLGEIGVIAGAFLVEEHRNAARIAVAWVVVAGICYVTLFRRSKAKSPKD